MTRIVTSLFASLLVAAILLRYFLNWLNDTVLIVLLAITLISYLVHMVAKYRMNR